MAQISNKALHKAIQCLLRPVLFYCLKHSLKLKEICELVKLTLVELAEEELKANNQGKSVSKISVMTGVHRKDVTEFAQALVPRDTGTSVHMRVVGQWRSDVRFLTPGGNPRPLQSQGKDSEFSELVRSVHKELNPYTVLFELQRVGIVEEKKGMLHLLGREYVPYGKIEAGFELISSDMRDLIVAAEENILKARPDPNLHLVTSYDNVSANSLSEIRAWFMTEGAALHERARQFLSKYDKDINPDADGASEGGSRVVIGTFSLTEEPAANSARAKKSSNE